MNYLFGCMLNWDKLSGCMLNWDKLFGCMLNWDKLSVWVHVELG